MYTQYVGFTGLGGLGVNVRMNLFDVYMMLIQR